LVDDVDDEQGGKQTVQERKKSTGERKKERKYTTLVHLFPTQKRWGAGRVVCEHSDLEAPPEETSPLLLPAAAVAVSVISHPNKI
jgi:hypothetical protein